MPPRNPRRPRDLNSLAFQLVREATGQTPPCCTPPPSEMAERGRAGGLKGGKARAAALTSKRRSEIAKKAARARWGK